MAASPVCPHCSFRPANEQGDLLPAANVLKQLDDELDQLLDGWVQTLLDNLEDPIIQSNFELLKEGSRKIVTGFVDTKSLPDPVTPEFINAATISTNRGYRYLQLCGTDWAVLSSA